MEIDYKKKAKQTIVYCVIFFVLLLSFGTLFVVTGSLLFLVLAILSLAGFGLFLGFLRSVRIAQVAKTTTENRLQSAKTIALVYGGIAIALAVTWLIGSLVSDEKEWGMVGIFLGMASGFYSLYSTIDAVLKSKS